MGSRGGASWFSELEDGYHFPLSCGRDQFFLNVLHRELSYRQAAAGRGLRLLDIGCGSGVEGRVESVRGLRGEVGEFWGLEPDPGVAVPAGIFDHVVRAPLERAELPRAWFDVAYSYLVAEHVEEPLRFLSAARAALSDEGVLYLLTPNAKHIFGMTSLFLQRLGLDELVLRLLRPRDVLAGYHYPVRYRMNTPSKLRSQSELSGFSSMEVAFVERPEDTLPYFPPAIRWIWSVAMGRRRRWPVRERLLHMVVRLSA